MKQITNFFSLFLLSTFCQAQSVASPDLKCLSVAPNGDVTLTWAIPADPGGNFVGYQIYSSPLSPLGPYGLVGTVNTYTQTSFTDVGAAASVQRVYYKIQTEYNPGPVLSAPLDTFSTIFLAVNNPGNGTAQLSWNKISNNPIPTSSGWYKIYREFPMGVWALKDSTQSLAYVDVIDVCNDSISYRIEIADNTGCTSVSNVDGGTFSDQTPPVNSQIDTVSVNAANLATISWNPSPSLDADSVIIYKNTGIWQQIASVKVPQTFYTYAASSAGISSERFVIAFKDSCGNLSPLGTEHHTIYLTTMYDVCAASASLAWNKYTGWNPAVTQYDIFLSVNSGTFNYVGTNPANDTTYTDTGLVIGNTYCYMVKATNGIKTSSSNKVCFSAGVSQPPAYTYNRYATVVSDKTIFLKAHVDPAQGVKYYRIRRATGTSGSYNTIANLPKTTSTTITYTDNAVSTQANSYAYKVESMDSCGNVILASNVGQTMLLKASVAPDAEVSLSWNDYDSWLGNVDHYNIHRAIDGVWNPSPIDSVSYTGSGGSYLDDVAPFLSTSKGVFTYFVVAVEGSGNPFFFADSSRSNTVQVKQFPKIYIPNTFTPNGDNLNDSFIPVIGFIEPTSFNMQIFDRTGTSIFISDNPTVGWNGTKKNHPCPEGVYMYIVKCLSANGEEAVLSGTVTLVR